MFYDRFKFFLERCRPDISRLDYYGNDLKFYAMKRKSSEAIDLINLYK